MKFRSTKILIIISIFLSINLFGQKDLPKKNKKTSKIKTEIFVVNSKDKLEECKKYFQSFSKKFNYLRNIELIVHNSDNKTAEIAIIALDSTGRPIASSALPRLRPMATSNVKLDHLFDPQFASTVLTLKVISNTPITGFQILKDPSGLAQPETITGGLAFPLPEAETLFIPVFRAPASP